MDTVPSRKLTREGAMKVLGVAVETAQATGLSASVAVVDDGGHLLAFARMDKAELYSIPICQAKARSAAFDEISIRQEKPYWQ